MQYFTKRRGEFKPPNKRSFFCPELFMHKNEQVKKTTFIVLHRSRALHCIQGVSTLLVNIDKVYNIFPIWLLYGVTSLQNDKAFVKLLYNKSSL